MNCFTHPLVSAVGICKQCGRGLCRECTAEVGLSLACKGRCEAEAGATNELTQRAKSAFDKAAGAYTQIAVFMGLAGLLFTGLGLFVLRKRDPVILVLGLLFLLLSGACFYTARRYRSRD
jgi:hypothetical protein